MVYIGYYEYDRYVNPYTTFPVKIFKTGEEASEWAKKVDGIIKQYNAMKKWDMSDNVSSEYLWNKKIPNLDDTDEDLLAIRHSVWNVDKEAWHFGSNHKKTLEALDKYAEIKKEKMAVIAKDIAALYIANTKFSEGYLEGAGSALLPTGAISYPHNDIECPQCETYKKKIKRLEDKLGSIEDDCSAYEDNDYECSCCGER